MIKWFKETFFPKVKQKPLVLKNEVKSKKISKEDIPPSTLKLIEEAEKNIKN